MQVHTNNKELGSDKSLWKFKIIDNKNHIIKLRGFWIKGTIEVDTLALPKIGDTVLTSIRNEYFLKKLEKNKSTHIFKCILNNTNEKINFHTNIQIHGVVCSNLFLKCPDNLNNKKQSIREGIECI